MRDLHVLPCIEHSEATAKPPLRTSDHKRSSPGLCPARASWALGEDLGPCSRRFLDLHIPGIGTGTKVLACARGPRSIGISECHLPRRSEY